MRRVILQGHSLGCAKAVHYVQHDVDAAVQKLLLLAPTDMVGWAKNDPRHPEYLNRTHALLAEGRGRDLVGTRCWMNRTPISAQTYPTICGVGSAADLYGDREGGALLGRIPIAYAIVYGDQDIGISQVYGTVDAWEHRLRQIAGSRPSVTIIPGADHGFCGQEAALASAAEAFATPGRD